MKNNDKCSIAMVPAGFQPIKRDFSIHSDVVKILNEKSRQFINWPVDGVSKRVRDKARALHTGNVCTPYGSSVSIWGFTACIGADIGG